MFSMLTDHEQRVTTIRTVQAENRPLLRLYGILGWTGNAELAEQVALAPDFPSSASGQQQ